MSLNIKHKRSSVNGSAPTPAQLEDGELAVNYNDADPALYVKDSAGAVVRIAGDGAVGATNWTRTGTELSPKTAGDDVFTSGDVKVGNTTGSPNINLLSSGPGEFAGGVRVTGGTNAQIPDGMLRTSTGLLGLRAGGAFSLLANSDQEIGLGGETPTAGQQVRLAGDFAPGDSFGYYNGCSISDGLTSASYVRSYLGESISAPLTVNSIKLFDASHPDAGGISADLTVSNMYGFYSEVNTLTRFTNSYNFYAAGDASNAFQGDVLIGGTLPSAPNITLSSAGLGEFTGGVKVTGGTPAGVGDGVRGGAGVIALVTDNDNALTIQKGSDRNLAALNSTLAAGVAFKIGGTTPSGDIVGTRIECDVTAPNLTLTAFDVNPQYTDGSNLTESNLYRAVFTEDTSLTALTTQKGFAIDEAFSIAVATDNYAFYTELNANTDPLKNNYNFYAIGTAPNAFAGNVLIGGTLPLSPNITLSDTGTASFAGDIEVTTNTAGLILSSPNGTRYRLTVDDAGVLSTVAA